MRFLVALSLVLGVVAPVNAALKVTSPTQVCDLMSDSGLSTRGWKNQYSQIFGCSSPYKKLGSDSALANNLAFYAEGNSVNVSQVKLVLNVNDRSSSALAHMELVKAASTLIEKSTGEKLSQSLINAIKNGIKITERVGSSTVEVVQIDWPTGKGYEVKVIIK